MQDAADRPVVPIDLDALARHATTLADELEKAWSAALDPDALERARNGLTARVGVLMGALTRALEARDERMHEAGIDVVLPEWPLPEERLVALLDAADTLEGQRSLLVVAQLQAVELVAEAFAALSEPSGVRVELLAARELDRWWEGGAFALLKSRALLLRSISVELDALDAEILNETVKQRREATDALMAAAIAYRRGDPQASLLAALHAAALIVPVPPGTEAGRWDALGLDSDFVTLRRLLERAEAVVLDLLQGRRVSWGFALPVAGALLPRVQRLVFAPPDVEG
jgi:hypothetical protein